MTALLLFAAVASVANPAPLATSETAALLVDRDHRVDSVAVQAEARSTVLIEMAALHTFCAELAAAVDGAAPVRLWRGCYQPGHLVHEVEDPDMGPHVLTLSLTNPIPGDSGRIQAIARVTATRAPPAPEGKK